MRAILASVLAGLVLGVCNSVSDTCMHPDAEFASSGPVDSHHLYAITVFLPFFYFFLSIIMVNKDQNFCCLAFLSINMGWVGGGEQTISPITYFFFF